MNEAKLQEFMGKLVGDMGGAAIMAIVILGEAGERRLRHVFAEAGFASFRRATETPFNLVLEARK